MRLAALAALVLAAAAGTATAGRVPPGTFSGCPRDVRPLPAAPLVSYAPAVRGAVLQFVRTQFTHISKTPSKLAGARTTDTFLVRTWRPSGRITTECGRALHDRSVGVNVYFPKLDLERNPVGRCDDCDHIVFLAAHTAGGWTVWGDY